MEGVVTFLCFAIWLALGGWAFARSLDGAEDSENTSALFLFCLALAPFAAGIAIAKGRGKSTPTTPTGE